MENEDPAGYRVHRAIPPARPSPRYAQGAVLRDLESLPTLLAAPDPTGHRPLPNPFRHGRGSSAAHPSDARRTSRKPEKVPLLRRRHDGPRGDDPQTNQGTAVIRIQSLNATDRSSAATDCDAGARTTPDSRDRCPVRHLPTAHHALPAKLPGPLRRYRITSPLSHSPSAELGLTRKLQAKPNADFVQPEF
jgi:hypothetical protein